MEEKEHCSIDGKRCQKEDGAIVENSKETHESIEDMRKDQLFSTGGGRINPELEEETPPQAPPATGNESKK